MNIPLLYPEWWSGNTITSVNSAKLTAKPRYDTKVSCEIPGRCGTLPGNLCLSSMQNTRPLPCTRGEIRRNAPKQWALQHDAAQYFGEGLLLGVTAHAAHRAEHLADGQGVDEGAVGAQYPSVLRRVGRPGSGKWWATWGPRRGGGAWPLEAV